MIELLCQFQCKGDSNLCVCSPKHCDYHYFSLGSIVDIANYAVAEDVVKVVRCKDCEFYLPIDGEEWGRCICIRCATVGDSFCSIGRKKDE